MPDETQQNTVLDAHRNYLRLKSSGRLTPPRSTLTALNALMFKPFFDTVIQTNAPVRVLYAELGCTPNTTYQKLNDAMRWLLVFDPQDAAPICTDPARRMEYATLRNKWKLIRDEEGITIHPDKSKFALASMRRPTVHKIADIAAELVVQHQSEQAGFRSALMDYIQNTPEGERPFIHKGIFTAEDKEWLKFLEAQFGIGYSFEPDGRLIVTK